MIALKDIELVTPINEKFNDSGTGVKKKALYTFIHQ
jgi:hypothetical protein